MSGKLGDRQQDLLRLLLKHKAGLTIDRIADSLGVTRTAVRQHLTALERDGFVCQGDYQKTAGRPGRSFRLTPMGIDSFPKQYSWFSGLVLDAIRRERGSEGLTTWLSAMAEPLVTGLQSGMRGKSFAEKVEKTVDLMTELEFEAEVVRDPHGAPHAIEATNCVYHDLARQFPEVCHFDLALIGGLAGAEVLHQECIVRGGNVCRFLLKEKGTHDRPDATP